MINKKIKDTKAVIQIHTGKRPIPDYAKHCVGQIHLLDPGIPIYFICSREKDVSTLPDYCTIIYENDLVISKEHYEFINVVIDKKISHFFQVTIERFFILYDAMITLGLEKILHLENDNLLYYNASSLIEELSVLYTKIATPRASKNMSCASIMFVPSQEALKDFLEYVTRESGETFFNDMALLPAYVDKQRGKTLPTLTNKYVLDNGLKTKKGRIADKSERRTDYTNFCEKLNGIFDCACLGQYTDGCDPEYHYDKGAGYINEDSYLDASKISIIWEKGLDGLTRPFFYENNNRYRIYNLHFHSKRLEQFMSDRVNN